MPKKGILASLRQKLNIPWFEEPGYFKWQKGIKLGNASWEAAYPTEQAAQEQLYQQLNFLFHLLRPGDIFVDADASVGIYSILASAAKAAYTFSFEPDPVAFEHLQHNIQLNKLEVLVTARQCAILGEAEGSADSATVKASGRASHPLTPSPTILDTSIPRSPHVLRISATALQRGILQGAQASLALSSLKVILLERADQEPHPSATWQALQQQLLDLHFVAYDYDPEYQKLQILAPQHPLGSIYCRDMEWIEARLNTADKQVLAQV